WAHRAEQLREAADAIALIALPLAAWILLRLALRIGGQTRRTTPIVVVLAAAAVAVVAVLTADAGSFAPFALVRVGDGDAWYHVPLAIGLSEIVIASFVVAFTALWTTIALL